MEEVTKEKYIFRVDFDGWREWYGVLSDIKDKMIKKQRKKLALNISALAKEGNFKKMLECVFRGSGIKCLIYGDKPAEQFKSTPRSRECNTETILIKKDDKTYSDLLKQTKKKMRTDSTAAQGIKLIRKTKDGGMLIVMDADRKDSIEQVIKEVGDGGACIRLGRDAYKKY